MTCPTPLSCLVYYHLFPTSCHPLTPSISFLSSSLSSTSLPFILLLVFLPSHLFRPSIHCHILSVFHIIFRSTRVLVPNKKNNQLFLFVLLATPSPTFPLYTTLALTNLPSIHYSRHHTTISVNYSFSITLPKKLSFHNVVSIRTNSFLRKFLSIIFPLLCPLHNSCSTIHPPLSSPCCLPSEPLPPLPGLHDFLFMVSGGRSPDNSHSKHSFGIQRLLAQLWDAILQNKQSRRRNYQARNICNFENSGKEVGRPLQEYYHDL